jgi:hypothetical protein
MLALSLAVAALSIYIEFGNNPYFLTISLVWMIIVIVILPDCSLVILKKKDSFFRLEAVFWICFGLWGLFMYYLDFVDFRFHPLLPIFPMLYFGIIITSIFYIATYTPSEPFTRREEEDRTSVSTLYDGINE